MMVTLVGPHFEDVDFLTAARAFSAMKTRQKKSFEVTKLFPQPCTLFWQEMLLVRLKKLLDQISTYF